MSKDYKISTNPYTLSQIKDILADVEINNIPVLDKGNDVLREYITTAVILALCDNITKLNAMFKQITQDPDIDFSLYAFNDLYEILNDFFVSTGDKLISWKKIQSNELNNQNGTDMMGMMELLMKNPDMMNALNIPSGTTSEA